MNIERKFGLNERVFQVSIEYERWLEILSKMNPKVGFQLSNGNDVYVVESCVREEILEDFLKYLSNGLEPEINSDNIVEYSFLNKEFGIIEDIIKKKLTDEIYYISCIKYLNKNKNDSSPHFQKPQFADLSTCEEFIALHLTDFITKYSKEMCNIPFTSLYNIFNHPKRNVDQNIAYDFIIKSSDENSEVLALLTTIDSAELDRQKVYNPLFPSN